MINKIWHGLGNIHLTVIVLLLLAADLAWGFYCLKFNNVLFQPLNETGLSQWIRTYGINNLSDTIWFFLLLILLFVLCVNTFVCTTDKVALLLKNRSHYTDKTRYFLKFSVHIMHYALIIMLTGYLFSYLFSEVYPSKTLLPGGQVHLKSAGLTIFLSHLKLDYYEGQRLDYFENRVIRIAGHLKLRRKGETRCKVISCIRPVWFKGYVISIKKYAPAQKGGMGQRTHLTLQIRKDPGLKFYFIGMGLFIIGLLMYVCQWGISSFGKGGDKCKIL
jgi:cytochrome c biogenesis protein ResB